MRFATVVYDRDGQPITMFSRNAQATLTPADYKRMLDGGMQYQEQISVPVKGDYFLRVGIKDSGKVGAIGVPVNNIPAATLEVATSN